MKVRWRRHEDRRYGTSWSATVNGHRLEIEVSMGRYVIYVDGERAGDKRMGQGALDFAKHDAEQYARSPGPKGSKSNPRRSRRRRNARKRGSSLPSADVSTFLLVLSSKLTQYDAREQRKHYNIYRLGHLLGAAEKVQKDMRGLESRSDPEAMARLKASIARRFTLPFRPASAVIRQIDAWVTSGKKPSLTRRN